MPLIYPKTWVPGEELAAADLNANFTASKNTFASFEILGFHVRDIVNIYVDTTLTANDYNKLIVFQASSLTVTLPNASVMPAETAFFICAYSPGTSYVSSASMIVYKGTKSTLISRSGFFNEILVAMPSRNEYVRV